MKPATRRRAAENRFALRAAPLTDPITPARLREALRRHGPEILAQPRVQAQLGRWWLIMRMLPRYVEWSRKTYAYGSSLDFVREAREGLLGIVEALIVKGKAGRPRRPRLSAEGLRSEVRAARNLVKEGRRRWREFAVVPPEEVFPPGFATLKIKGRPVDLIKDQAREIAIVAVARAAQTSVHEVREAIAGHSKSRPKF